jgi:hypothetical protein
VMSTPTSSIRSSVWKYGIAGIMQQFRPRSTVESPTHTDGMFSTILISRKWCILRHLRTYLTTVSPWPTPTLTLIYRQCRVADHLHLEHRHWIITTVCVCIGDHLQQLADLVRMTISVVLNCRRLLKPYTDPLQGSRVVFN